MKTTESKHTKKKTEVFQFDRKPVYLKLPQLNKALL